jgi:hypothetical protein
MLEPHTRELLLDLAEICRRHLQISATRKVLYKDAYDDWITVHRHKGREVVYYVRQHGQGISVSNYVNRQHFGLLYAKDDDVVQGVNYSRYLCTLLLNELQHRMVLDALAAV